MPTYHATWTDVPQLDLSGSHLFTVMAEAQYEYEDLAGEPEDDPDYMSPDMLWRLVRVTSQESYLGLYADGKSTGVRIYEEG
jgi:hypothetical protein